jgi:DNA polymerase I-like protein with 3'-5' exonuclease and polymerase domains
VFDLRRARAALAARPAPPDYRFTVAPTFDNVDALLGQLLRQAGEGPLKLAVDLETLAGHIACVGIAWSRLDALCIPLIASARQEGYWTLAQERDVVRALRALLTHQNVEVVGQNFIYDAQYLWRHWGFLPRVTRDTMLWHHTLWAGAMPKGLDFLSSIYCTYHRYWKNEGKEWHTTGDDEREWVYNCKDAVITWEVDAALVAASTKMGLRAQCARQQEMFWPVFTAMRRGVDLGQALSSWESSKTVCGLA